MVNGAYIGVPHTSSEPCALLGDVNLDLSVDIIDVVQLVAYILDEPIVVEQPLCGDMDNSLVLDVTDIILMVQYIVGNN